MDFHIREGIRVSSPLKVTLFVLSWVLIIAVTAHADDQPTENPVAKQFREHLEAADLNKDGFVTPEELTAEISQDPKRDPETVKRIVSAMMDNLDTNHDGKLSKAEVLAGARLTGQRATAKLNVERAEQVLAALNEYQAKHRGNRPTELADLEKLNLLEESSLRCILADGSEKPWRYESGDEEAGNLNTVIVISPGQIDADGQYIVGLNNGKVLGLREAELDLTKTPRLKMEVHLDN